MSLSEFCSTFLVQTLLRGTGWLLLIIVLAHLLRRASASCRALLWQMAFVGLALLPLLLFALPPLPLAQIDHAVQFEEHASRQNVPPPIAFLPPIARPADAVSASPTPTPPTALLPAFGSKSPMFATTPSLWLAKGAALLCIAWGMGAAWYLISLVVSWFALRRLGRCTVGVSQELIEDKREIEARFSLNRRVALGMAAPESGLHAPITWGIFRPVVMLPASYARETPAHCRAALLHELAHIRRGDWAWLLLAQITCSLYWCVPFVWIAARHLCRETELACDDSVLASGVSAPDYAAQILEAACILKSRNAYLPLSVLTMARPPLAQARIHAILDARRNRQPASRWLLVMAAMLPMCCAPLLALRAVAVSEDRARPLLSSLPPETALPLQSPFEATSVPALAEGEADGATRSRTGSALRSVRPDTERPAEQQTTVAPPEEEGSANLTTLPGANRDSSGNGIEAGDSMPEQRPIQWGTSRKIDGFQVGARMVSEQALFKTGDVIKFQGFGRNLSDRDISLVIGRYWKVNYEIQIETSKGKPVYMKRDAHNQAMLVAGYLQGTLGKGATQEISEAALQIAPVSKGEQRGAVNREENDRVETVSLLPGRYRVRLVSRVMVRIGDPSAGGIKPVASGWMPFEVTSK